MNIAWCTDTHFDMYEAPDFVLEYGRQLKGLGFDRVLITGDISQADKLLGHLAQLAQTFPGDRLLYVLGNHDLWGSSRRAVHQSLGLAGTGVHLSQTAPVQVAPGVYVTGFDGWYDARHGKPLESRFLMNDWPLVDELRAHYYAGRVDVGCKQLADESASDFIERVRDLPADCDRLIVATHIPPYPECSWHRGKPSDPLSLPWYCSRASGDALDRVAKTHPGVKIDVFCGHTHSHATYRRQSNMVIHTGHADYGVPAVSGKISV